MKVEKYEIPDSAKTYKAKDPFMATVESNELLTEEGSEVEVRNIMFDLRGSGIDYIEGQSIGIVPPGIQENGKPHRVRLYSIASARKGDDGLSRTVTLCVKRVVFTDEETGEEVRGLASNYLCDLQPGDRVPFMGPTGRHFFLPEDDNTDLILIAAGSGIAPFRAFIHHIYNEKGHWNGKVRLFFGARNGMDSLYLNDENNDIGQYMSMETFKAFRALSQADEDHPEKGYVQHRMQENSEEIWEIMKRGNYSVYICGMKAIEEGTQDVFRKLAERDGIDWDTHVKDLKKQGRWNVEVY
jgi:ferredoxin--NADP+ reductase